MAIKDYYPTIRPSLDLNFAASRTVDPRITFSRSGTGNVASYFDDKGVMRFAAPNTPRIDFDPITGECKGLLLEEQRTNLLTYSSQFDDVSWGKIGATATANAAISPDGGSNADLVTVASIPSVIFKAVTLTPSTSNNYYASVFVKSGTLSSVTLNVYYTGEIETNVVFNLSSKTVSGNIPFAGDYIIEETKQNGWFRVGFRAALDSTGAATTLNFRIWPGTRDQQSIGGSVYVYGAQLEQGLFPTSYIPTTSAQVTRASDSAIMVGGNFSSWFNQAEGTMLVEASVPAFSQATVLEHPFFTVSDLSLSNFISTRAYSIPTGYIGFDTWARSGLVKQFDATEKVISEKVKVVKQAVSYTSSSYSHSVDGNSVSSATSVLIPVVNTAEFGQIAGTNQQTCHIRRAKFYPRNFQGFALQALTT